MKVTFSIWKRDANGEVSSLIPVHSETVTYKTFADRNAKFGKILGKYFRSLGLNPNEAAEMYTGAFEPAP